MPAGVAVFCSECRPKSVHAAEAAGKVLCLQLARHCEEGRLGEEVLGPQQTTIDAGLVQ